MIATKASSGIFRERPKWPLGFSLTQLLEKVSKARLGLLCAYGEEVSSLRDTFHVAEPCVVPVALERRREGLGWYFKT